MAWRGEEDAGNCWDPNADEQGVDDLYMMQRHEEEMDFTQPSYSNSPVPVSNDFMQPLYVNSTVVVPIYANKCFGVYIYIQ